MTKFAIYAEMPVWLAFDTPTDTIERIFVNEHDVDNLVIPSDASVFLLEGGWLTGDDLPQSFELDLLRWRARRAMARTSMALEVIPG